jgi:uncharacterized membrane protein YhaH (DUF805 family)
MKIAQAIGKGFTRSFQFSGQASRLEYWAFLPVGLALPAATLYAINAFFPNLGLFWNCTAFFGALMPLMAVTRRRLLDTGEAPVWFETPLAALLWCIVSGAAFFSLKDWAFAAWDAGADGPSGFGVFLCLAFGSAILIPIFAQNLLIGFLTGTALFGQMAAPTKHAQDNGNPRHNG